MIDQGEFGKTMFWWRLCLIYCIVVGFSSLVLNHLKVSADPRWEFAWWILLFIAGLVVIAGLTRRMRQNRKWTR